METNKILKNLVMKNVYGKRNELKHILNVDIENCEPIDVTKLKYNNQFKDNLFLFIDFDFQLIGVLKGSVPEKKFIDVLSYSHKYEKLIRNRKNLTPISEYILMITPEMRCYQAISRKNRVNIQPIDLQQRLLNYKKDKVSKVDDESVLGIIQEVILFISVNLYNKDYPKSFYKIGISIRDMFDVLYQFSNESKKYVNEYNEFEEFKLKLKNVEKTIDEDYYFRSKKSRLQELKIEILEWYKVVNNLKQ